MEPTQQFVYIDYAFKFLKILQEMNQSKSTMKRVLTIADKKEMKDGFDMMIADFAQGQKHICEILELLKNKDIKHDKKVTLDKKAYTDFLQKTKSFLVYGEEGFKTLKNTIDFIW